MCAGWWIPSFNDYRDQRLNWRRKFFLLPKRCERSNQVIWLRKGWHGWRWVTGPGEPIAVDHWMSDKEYMWFRISGE